MVAIVGPTATGKSALSLHLAEALSSEIVNADSMQLYRGMDIGTAKLPPDARRGIAHHVLDVWSVREPASVAAYQQLAREAIDGIAARGRVPILVGGSGLYIRAALERFDFPGTDPALRAALEAELAAVGPGPLHARLAERDPAAAGKVLPTNGRRVVRALEVIELTGGPFTAALPQPDPVYRTVQIGLDVQTSLLDRRIGERVTAMWEAGFVDEVRGLLPQGIREGLTASRALGYQQVLAYLDGEHGEDRALVDTVTATRRFARRQRKWFRRDTSITWLDATAPSLVADASALARAAAST